MTRGGDGIVDLGKDRLGKRWWRARLFWTCPLTGKQLETRRKFSAPSKGAALLRRDELLEEVRTGTARTTRPRFRDVSAEYAAAITVHATRCAAESYVRKLDEHFGEWWLDVITTRHVQDYLDALTLASVNNVRNALVGIFRLAVQKRYIDLNVAKLTERRRAAPVVDADEDELEPEATRALTPEQLAAYLDDMELHEPDLYPLIHTQFMLGCRFAEVTALRRARVDLATGLVEIRRGQFRGVAGRTKGKRARKAALPAEGLALLKAHLERMDAERWPGWEDLCFPRPPFRARRGSHFWAATTVHEKIAASFARCGIEVTGKTHVARHTMVTIAHSLEMDEALFRETIGHRSKRVHQGYVHAHDAQRIEIGEKVGRELLKGRGERDGGTTLDEG